MSDNPKSNQTRRVEIENAAYALLAEKGFKATSMLEVAKRARASNQTMYKWYGDKTGLFLSMVEHNASDAKSLLQDALRGTAGLEATVDALGPALLELVLGDRAVALNRAAAASAHDSDALGAAIVAGGRAAIATLLAKLIAKEALTDPAGSELAAGLYLDVLIGDAQIRRVTGVDSTPDQATIKARAARAKSVLWRWLDWG